MQTGDETRELERRIAVLERELIALRSELRVSRGSRSYSEEAGRGFLVGSVMTVTALFAIVSPMSLLLVPVIAFVAGFLIFKATEPSGRFA